MPLTQLNNSIPLRNKQNASQIDPQNHSPTKDIINNKWSPHKRSQTLQNEFNLLKIKLSDRQFELKKLEEDCSIKLSQMHKQLSKQKMQKKNVIKEYKQKLDEEKQYYEKKLMLLNDQHRKESINIEQIIKSKIIQKFKQQKQTIIANYQSRITNLTNQIRQINEQFDTKTLNLQNYQSQQRKKLIQSHNKAIKQLQQARQKQIESIKSKHRAQIQFYKHSQQIKIKQHQVVQKILIDKIKKFQQDLHLFKTDLNVNLSQLEIRNAQISNLLKEKEKYRLDSIYWQRKFNKLQTELTQKFKNQVQNNKMEYQTKLTAQIQNYEAQLQKIKTIHHQSIKTCENKNKLLQQRFKKVTQILKNYKSNQDDIKKIQTLQIKLIRKQFELEKQRQDLKICKLQLNNMDEMYHKMFEQAKVKSLKTKKLKLPSLLGQNKSTMDVYNPQVNPHYRQRKFSIRECANQNHSVSKNLKQQQISIQQ